MVLLAGAAVAALSVSSTSTFNVSVRTPPVHFELGAGASNSRYASDVSVTANGTSFGAAITGRLGGDATDKDVVRLVSASSASRSVTLRGTQVTNPNVPIHTWTVKNGTTTVATLDMRTSDPSASFTLPVGETYKLDMRVKVIRGIASSEATFSSSVWAVVT